MRRFGADNIQGVMDKIGMMTIMPIENGMISRSIENAQKKVEARNFEIRKNVLEYDNVANKQREVIYGQRRQVLVGENVEDSVLNMIELTSDMLVQEVAGEHKYPEEWDLEALNQKAREMFLLREPLDIEKMKKMEADEVKQYVKDIAIARYHAREEELGARSSMN